jgi:hypothetical protein
MKTYEDVAYRFRKIIRESKNYPFIWVEVNGQAFAAVLRDQWVGSEMQILLPGGKTLMGKKQNQIRGTGKSVKVGNAWQYIPPRYYEYANKSFGPTEAGDKLYGMFYEAFKAMVADGEEKKDIDDFIKTQDFEIKALTVDKNRAQLAASRKMNRPDQGGRLLDNQRAALRKLVLDKLQPKIAAIQKSLPTAADIERSVNAMLDGSQTAKITIPENVINDLRDLNSIVQSISSNLRSSRNARDRDYSGDGNPKGIVKSWDFERLMDKIKSL